MAERPERRRLAKHRAARQQPGGDHGLDKEKPCRPEDGRAAGNSHQIKEAAAMAERSGAGWTLMLIRRKETSIPYEIFHN